MKLLTPPPRFRVRGSRGVVTGYTLPDGRTIIRKWPVKRKRSLPPITQQQVATWDSLLPCIRTPEPSEYAQALQLTQGNAFYAQDVLYLASYGHWLNWHGWGPRAGGPALPSLMWVGLLRDLIVLPQAVLTFDSVPNWVTPGVRLFDLSDLSLLPTTNLVVSKTDTTITLEGGLNPPYPVIGDSIGFEMPKNKKGRERRGRPRPLGDPQPVNTVQKWTAANDGHYLDIDITLCMDGNPELAIWPCDPTLIQSLISRGGELVIHGSTEWLPCDPKYFSPDSGSGRTWHWHIPVASLPCTGGTCHAAAIARDIQPNLNWTSLLHPVPQHTVHGTFNSPVFAAHGALAPALQPVDFLSPSGSGDLTPAFNGAIPTQLGTIAMTTTFQIRWTRFLSDFYRYVLMVHGVTTRIFADTGIVNTTGPGTATIALSGGITLIPGDNLVTIGCQLGNGQDYDTFFGGGGHTHIELS